MRILITGGKGFVANHLANKLKKSHEVQTVDREDFDHSNREEVEKWFENRYYDIIIHTAMQGGRRHIEEDDNVFLNNLKMYLNIASEQDKFRYLFNFTSGADYDKSVSIDGDKNNLYTSYPKDHYGLAKNLIARLMRQHFNFYNFRIYGVFGKDEADKRFISTSLKNLKNNKDIEVFEDKFFDFVYIDDLTTVISYYVNTIDSRKEALPSELEVVYSQKHKLSDIANMMLKIHKSGNLTLPSTNDLGNSFIGTQYGIEWLPVKIKGLNKGIKELYNEI